jgi:acetylornithine/LysW-gamma-L-lysine aminotransferase
LAAIEAYRDEDLIKRSATLGANLRNTLRGALEGVAIVRDIRGLGLMIGVELRTKVAPVLKSLMMEHGVIALPAGPTVLRLLPPLVITEKEIEFGVQAIAKAIRELPPSPTGLPPSRDALRRTSRRDKD